MNLYDIRNSVKVAKEFLPITVQRNFKYKFRDIMVEMLDLHFNPMPGQKLTKLLLL